MKISKLKLELNQNNYCKNKENEKNWKDGKNC
jgi:hypothetical protein